VFLLFRKKQDLCVCRYVEGSDDTTWQQTAQNNVSRPSDSGSEPQLSVSNDGMSVHVSCRSGNESHQLHILDSQSLEVPYLLHSHAQVSPYLCNNRMKCVLVQRYATVLGCCAGAAVC
jgi:hypothetical protein